MFASDLAIHVECLSKRYRIAHQSQRSRYRTLREDLIALPERLASWLLPASKSKIQNEHSEEFWAVKDVSFEVKQGEVVGIIGRNGAGKSTLLKLLSRISEPTGGRADIYGRVGSLLEVGTGFHPELTGRENIFLNGAILGMRKAEIRSKFDEIVSFAEVERFIDTPVKRYSSGMYMRLAFAVAAHLEPEILIVDEVLAVGDAEFQKKCLGKMKTIGKSGRTVLFVSHNMNAIEQLCGRVILLDKGRIQACSSKVRDVIETYVFGGGDESYSPEWNNRDREITSAWFTPLRFALTDEIGQKRQTPVSNDSDLWLQIEGEIHQSDPAFNIGYALYADDGQLLYWSFHTDCAPEQWPQINMGLVKLRTKIPKRFLNEGRYRLELLASLHFRSWLLQPGSSPASFFFHIQGGLSESPLWMVKRPGVLAPVFEWVLVHAAT